MLVFLKNCVLHVVEDSVSKNYEKIKNIFADLRVSEPKKTLKRLRACTFPCNLKLLFRLYCNEIERYIYVLDVYSVYIYVKG